MRSRVLFALLCVLAVMMLWLPAAATPLPPIEPLLTQLRSEETNTRITAIQQLAMRGDELAFTALLPLTQDGNATVRVATWRALGSFPDDLRLTDALIAGMKDADPGVRRALFDTFRGRMCDPRLIEPLAAVAKTGEIPHVIAGILAEMGAPAVPTLIDLSNTTDANTRRNVMVSLAGTHDTRVTPVLRAALRDPLAEVRAAAVEALGGLQDPACRNEILALLKDENIKVHLSAAVALVRYDDPAVDEAIAPVFTEINPEGRRSILYSTTWCRSAAHLSLLVRALQDPDAKVRETALQALDYTGDDPRITDLLLTALADKDATVLAAAVRAVGRHPDDRLVLPLLDQLWQTGTVARVRTILRLDIPRATDVLPNWQPGIQPFVSVLSALSAIGRPAMASLVAALHDPAPDRRAVAAMGLIYLQRRDAIPPLCATLADPDETVSCIAARGLGRLGDNTAMPALQAACRDPRPAVRAQAAWALGVVCDARAVDDLLALLNDPAPDVAFMATFALGRLADPAATPRLREVAATHTDAGVREQALLTTKTKADPRADTAVDPLLAQLNDPARQSVVIDTLAAYPEEQIISTCMPLARMGASAFPVIRALLEQATPSNRARYLSNLAYGWSSLGTPEAPFLVHDTRLCENLLTTFRSPNNQQLNAMFTLVKHLECPESVPGLLTVLPSLRTGAASQTVVIGMLGRSHDPRALPALVPLLSTGAYNARLCVIKALGELENPAAVTSLQPLAQDADPAIRTEAAAALARLKDKSAGTRLMHLLPTLPKSSYPSLIPGLGATGDPRAVPVLESMLKNVPPDKHREIAAALGQIADPSADAALIRLLRDPRVEIEGRRAAIRVLAIRPSPAAHAAVIATLDDNRCLLNGNTLLPASRYLWSLRAQAIEAVSGMQGPDVIPALTKSAITGTAHERILAAQALAKPHDRQAIPGLIVALAQLPGDARSAIADALRALTGQDFGENAGKWREWWKTQEK
jgi:HEAT repeat protein